VQHLGLAIPIKGKKRKKKRRKKNKGIKGHGRQLRLAA